MATALVPEIPAPGFSFDLCQRNAFLAKKGFPAPKAQKTGTTIVGIIYKDGVILGADTRATEGNIVADKKSRKIHFLADNMYCCGAGTAADTEMTTDMIASQLELHRLNTNRVVPVVTAAQLLKSLLFRYQGNIGAALIVGGVDPTGPHLYFIYPHGSCDHAQYATMGSGSLAAMSVFESKWKPGLTEEQGKLLVSEAIRAGVLNDLGSGNSIDLTVIRQGNTITVDYIRPYEITCTKGIRQGDYRYKKGTTAILTKYIRPILVEEQYVRKTDTESMDTSG